MIVYANSFFIDNTIPEILPTIAEWINYRNFCHVSDPGKLLKMSYRNDSSLEANSTLFRDPAIYPQMLSINIRHNDSAVWGRIWNLDIGLVRDENKPTRFSLVLKTEELNSSVERFDSFSMPSLIKHLVKKHKIITDRYCYDWEEIDNEDDLVIFASALDVVRRDNPVVAVSRNSEGAFNIDITKLREKLFGLAEMYILPCRFDVKTLDKALRYGGGISIIMPPRLNKPAYTYYYNPADVDDSLIDKIALTVIHSTNPKRLRDALDPNFLAHTLLRRQLVKWYADLASSSNMEATFEEYTHGIEEENETLRGEVDKLLHDVESLRLEIEETESHYEDELAQVNRQLEQFKALQFARPSVNGMLPGDFTSIMKETLAPSPTPEQSLSFFEAIYPDRMVVLDTAYKRSKESDIFRYKAEFFKLLETFFGPYYECLVSGLGSLGGKDYLGKYLAMTEGDAPTAAALKRRTFYYNGQYVVMEKHLKIGGAYSPAETIRLHFEWFAEEKRLIIGYLGPHLDVN